MNNVTCIKPIHNTNFDGGNITPNGGLPLFMNFFDSLGLSEKLQSVPFNETRDVNTISFSNSSILTNHILCKMLGYNCTSDLKSLKNDPVMYADAIPSQSTSSRLYSRITEDTVDAIHETLTDYAFWYVNTYVAFPVLDIDSTHMETFGKQENSDYNAHYHETGFHPQEVNEAVSGLLLSAKLRNGSTYSSEGCVEMLKEILDKLQHRIIYVRGDSAYCRQDLMEFINQYNEQMEERGINKKVIFYFRCKNFGRVCQTIYDNIFDREIDLFTMDINKKIYGSCQYTFLNSGKSYQTVYEVQPVEDEAGQRSLFPKVFAVLTNDTGRAIKLVIKKVKTKENPEEKQALNFYRKRGASENYNRELKEDCGARKLSHNVFVQNEYDFMVSCLVFNIGCLFKNLLLTGKEKKQRFSTLREKLLKIPGKITMHARKTVLSLSSSFIYQKLYQCASARLESLSLEFQF